MNLSRPLIATAVATFGFPQRSLRGRRPRVLLLTSGLGTGHSRAAAAIERALQDAAGADAIRTETVDFWSLLDAGVARALQQTYLRLVTERPGLYQHLYQLDQHSWRDILERGEPLPALLHDLDGLIEPLPDTPPADGERHWLDRLLYRELAGFLTQPRRTGSPLSQLRQQAIVHRGWRLLAKRLQRCIEQFGPDAVVATQVNMAALAASLKARGRLDAPLTGVLTDYGVHDFWVQDSVDRYCVADESMRQRLRGRVPGGVDVTGIPLMPEFATPPEPAAARRRLGLDAARPVLLVLGGGLGLGIDSVVAAIARATASGDGPTILVLAGRNERLAGELARDPATGRLIAAGRLQVHGWTDRIVTFLRAADIVIGKPGGLSTAEVLACGRPLYSTCSLRGQESFNVSFLENHGVGQLLDEPRLLRRVLGLLDDPLTLRRMQARAWALGRRDGAARVAAGLLESLRWTAARA